MYRPAACLILLLLVVACSDTSGPGAQSSAAKFDEVWATFDREYSYFNYKKIDWNAARAQYRERAAAAATDEQLVAVLREMAAPLRDVHVWFRRADGKGYATYQPTAPLNYRLDVLDRFVRLNGWHPVKKNLGYTTIGEVGYVMIGVWNDGDFSADDVDGILNQLRNAPSLIIDVRMNSGGNDQLAMDVAARFATKPVVVEYTKFRNGPGHDDFGALIARRLEPRGAWQYTKPVVVLSGRGVFSSNETFVLAMRILPHVTVLGDTTGGGSGNPGAHKLGNWGTYYVSRWIAYDPQMNVIEWQGVAPEELVPWTASQFSDSFDPIIVRALERLRAQP